MDPPADAPRRWISGGGLDDVPADLFDQFPRLKALVGSVRALPALEAWYAASA